MQRQKRISDSASIETPPSSTRMETDQCQMEESHLGSKKLRMSDSDRTFSSESAVVRAAIDVKEYFKEYCNATAIHGVRYFAEDGRFGIEKFFWVIAITVSMTGCFHLIMKVWHKWDSSPVIVSFAESSTSIWEVPFPAVSICPETKSCQTKFNFTEKYHMFVNFSSQNNADFSTLDNNATKEYKMFQAVSLLCDGHILTTGDWNMPMETIADLRNVAPQLSDMIITCRWQGKVIENCTDLFKPVWSDEGLCFTFNMFDNTQLFTKTSVQYSEINSEKDYSDWNPEEGTYFSNGKLDTYPRRALGAGARSGLFILLKANESDLDYLCRGPVQGFKILLHNSVEIPQVGQQYFRVPLNQEVVAAVKPSMMTTSPGLRGYAPHRRQCYFPRERQLRFFQVYTQKNCELECITNFTLQRCGCVSFYMPRINDTEICGPGGTNCTVDAFDRLVRGGSPSSRAECDCLVSCVSLEYDAETSQADYNWRSVFTAFKVKYDEIGPGLVLSRFTIFFKDIQFITNHRSELYGQTDFLANCGGLLGLFSGFSFISLVEILYFVTLRLWCRFEMKRRERRPSSQDTKKSG